MTSAHRFFASVLMTGLTVCLVSSTAAAQQVSTSQSEEVSLGGSNGMFSARVALGYLSGEAHEYVYDGPGSGEKISELIWDLDNIFMAGIGVSFRPLTWLTFHADGWTNVNDGDGEMDDYDWLVRSDAWSDWSHSNQVELDTGTIFDVNAEVTLVEQTGYRFGVLVGYRVENWKWKDYGDGIYIYSDGGFRNETGYFAGDTLGISYEQTFKTPYVGVAMQAYFGSFELEGRVIGSTLVQLDADDYHYLRDIYFKDSCEDGQMIAVELNGRYRFTENLSVTAGYVFQKYDEVEGDETAYYGTGEVYVNPNGAAGDLTYHQVSVGLTYTF